jgi:hypothetical protein
MQRRDGSLTLYIQHEAPEGGKGAEWIPAPAGPLFMAGRFYGPEASLIDGSYKIPECIRNRYKRLEVAEIEGDLLKAVTAKNIDKIQKYYKKLAQARVNLGKTEKAQLK